MITTNSGSKRRWRLPLRPHRNRNCIRRCSRCRSRSRWCRRRCNRHLRCCHHQSSRRWKRRCRRCYRRRCNRRCNRRIRSRRRNLLRRWSHPSPCRKGWSLPTQRLHRRQRRLTSRRLNCHPRQPAPLPPPPPPRGCCEQGRSLHRCRHRHRHHRMRNRRRHHSHRRKRHRRHNCRHRYIRRPPRPRSRRDQEGHPFRRSSRQHWQCCRPCRPSHRLHLRSSLRLSRNSRRRTNLLRSSRLLASPHSCRQTSRCRNPNHHLPLASATSIWHRAAVWSCRRQCRKSRFLA